MDYKLIDIAYGALLHDIGKLYQRTKTKDDLTDHELECALRNDEKDTYSHLHSGYTSRFLREELGLGGEFEKLVSAHHQDASDRFSQIIRLADVYASSIDAQDEDYDTENNNRNGQFIAERMYSVFKDVDFGKEKKEIIYRLSDFRDIKPESGKLTVEESVEDYRKLFDEFVDKVRKNTSLKNRKDLVSYNYMHNLLGRYATTVPASTYNGMKNTVSLYDHLRLTSAIASCLYYDECFENDRFCMLEIDISGIQSFIYKVVEGSGNKPGLTRALRGRSILVGIVSNAVARAFLNEFGLTDANIIFNTGGGAMLLLPWLNDVQARIEAVAEKAERELFGLFGTDLTFSYAGVDLTSEELTLFKSEKALELKQKLEERKLRKYSNIIGEEFFYKKPEGIINFCSKCGNPSDKGVCPVCDAAEKLSAIYTKNDSFGIVYDYGNADIPDRIDDFTLNLGFVKVCMTGNIYEVTKSGSPVYVDSINDFGYGMQKMVSNQVPLDRYKGTLTFSDILALTPEKYGVPKLAILKMDVDNLGGIFAFGLKNTKEKREQRSISKYVTMSRLMEYFFGYRLKDICVEVSEKVNSNLGEKVANDTLFYINYAGGDDLVIMGSVYSICLLANEINKQFKAFTGNSNITLSGGIHIQNDKKPVRFGIQQAEEQLELSKSKEKNAISVMGTRVSFNDFEALLDESLELMELIDSGQLSRTMIYNIMSVIDDKSFRQYAALVPRIQYTLYRSLEKKPDLYQKMLKKVNGVNDNGKSLAELVLKLKLAIFFTRD